MIYFKKLLAINILFVLAISMSKSAWSFDKIHLQRCLATKNCEGADLRGADLSYANFSKTKLRDADLEAAHLSGADLSRTNLRNSNLDKAILCKTQMPWGIDNSVCK